MTSQRAARREALRRLVSRGTFKSLGELRLALAARYGHRVKVPQLSLDLAAIGAWREARWTIEPPKEGRRVPDDVMNPMPATASSRTGPTRPDVDPIVSKGAAPAAHPELAADHPDAKILKVQAAEP